MIKIVNLGALWRKGHGLLEGSETLGLSSRVRRAAPSLQTQTDETVVASYGLAKTVTLTMQDDGGRERVRRRERRADHLLRLAVPAWRSCAAKSVRAEGGPAPSDAA